MDKFSLIRGITYVLFGVIFAVAAVFDSGEACRTISIVFTMLGVDKIFDDVFYGDDDEE